MKKMKNNWCDTQDVVWGEKIHRCSSCRKRLKPMNPRGMQIQWKLPPHKKKGHKIRKKKGHNIKKDK
jgi:hypothetical protein